VYVDSNEIFRPDPVSTHFISESERFDKDFNVADSSLRQAKFNQKEEKVNKLREERTLRDTKRYDKMVEEGCKDSERI